MPIGPNVFGDGRRGLWVAFSANLTDKLWHFLPRLHNAIPNLTDLFLPPEAERSHRDQVRAAGFFAHMYDVAHAKTAFEFADRALVRHSAQGAGGLELNFEGPALTDSALASYIQATIKRLRSKKPNLPVRINVVPFKGEFLPVEFINHDPHLFVCAQTYGGNMEYLYAADEVLNNLTNYGIFKAKANVMHAVMCGTPRQITLPLVRNTGAFYIDDLLLDAELL